MSQEQIHPLEAILRMCARAAPQPWYPRHFIRETGADPDQVDHLLELLSLEGLVQKAPGTLDAGTGATLTPLGEQVVADPDLMDRLCRGEPIRSEDPGAIVRNSLRRPVRPVVVKVLIALNVLAFLGGGWVASQKVPSLWGTYMSFWPVAALPGYVKLLVEIGAATQARVEAGDWWRLLTTAFLHSGLLHIGMNMYALWVLGAFAEQVWGRWRLLVIYLVAAWTGSCLGLAYLGHPGMPVVGASTAVCGVLGSVIVWVLLCGKYLPKEMARRGRNQLFVNVVLLVFISLIPGVSGLGHLGGALGGAAAAVLLHYQRFGPAVLRWAAPLLLLPLPLISYAQMKHAWEKKPPARVAKEKDEEKDKEEPAKEGKKKQAKKEEDAGWPAGPFYRHHAEPVYDAAKALEKIIYRMPVSAAEIKEDPKLVKQTLEGIERQRKVLARQQTELKESGDKLTEKAREQALVLIKEALALCELAKSHMDSPGKESQKKLQAQLREVENRNDEFEKEMKALRNR
jgi:rhomboid protease GluP